MTLTVRAEALFVSALQPSEKCSTAQLRAAIETSLEMFGPAGCAQRLAAEFGEHPETAVPRMRWALERAAAS
ncbi:hypothetical protein [Cryptosporangium aurantiacum]|uniref:Uncharacterized protein n=1 Tax=Cryptosporangium aurantiacum TaxID=134849 RepID=A0A1M7REC3_9ACTN|nr:hypothetical protein [Cryptosporangium aurantiacum]SHN44531.1 hypothetical protein SAMN05443668_110247 [Cryptosporangium aurantiacum]